MAEVAEKAGKVLGTVSEICMCCGRPYNHRIQWCICPHGPLDKPSTDCCAACGNLKSVDGPCVHQRLLEDKQFDVPMGAHRRNTIKNSSSRWQRNRNKDLRELYQFPE